MTFCSLSLRVTSRQRHVALHGQRNPMKLLRCWRDSADMINRSRPHLSTCWASQWEQLIRPASQDTHHYFQPHTPDADQAWEGRENQIWPTLVESLREGRIRRG